MKHVAIVLLSLVVLALAPAVIPAQGLLEGGLLALPGIPSIGNMLGRGDSCDGAGPGPLVVDGTVAWNYQTIDLSYQTLGAGLLGGPGVLGALKHAYRFSGLQLGVSAQAESRTGVGGIVRFDILLTGSSTDTENYNEALGGGVIVPEGSRHWRAKNDTYCVDGMGFYKLYKSAALVGGFRWNHLETSFDNANGAIIVPGLPGDEAVLVTNVYQPYVGVMVDQGGANRVLRAGVIGWPQLYGSAKYEQTFGAAFVTGARANGLTAKLDRGYFWEIFGEYGLREQMLMGAALSIFGKWTQYHLAGTFNADMDVIGLGNVDSDFGNISMHRNSWTAGLKLDVPFAVPMPGYF